VGIAHIEGVLTPLYRPSRLTNRPITALSVQTIAALVRVMREIWGAAPEKWGTNPIPSGGLLPYVRG